MNQTGCQRIPCWYATSILIYITTYILNFFDCCLTWIPWEGRVCCLVERSQFGWKVSTVCYSRRMYQCLRNEGRYISLHLALVSTQIMYSRMIYIQSTVLFGFWRRSWSPSCCETVHQAIPSVELDFLVEKAYCMEYGINWIISDHVMVC